MLATRGCADFSTDRLAKELGVGKGTVYVHFPSQRGCVETVLATAAAHTLEALPPLAGSSERQVAALVDALVAALAKGTYGKLSLPCCLRLSPCPYSSWAAAEEPLYRLIDSGVREGRFPDLPDARAAARAFHHLLTALELHRRQPPQREHLLEWGRRAYLRLLGIEC
jgi:AcrR family transcriptional regulator